MSEPGESVELRRYPSRKLYNKTTSSYVRLQDVAELIRSGAAIRVEDTETGEDVTRQVLLQIILEQEAQADRAMLSADLLMDMIRMSQTRASELMTSLFEQSVAFMRQQQDKLAVQLPAAMGASLPGPWAMFDPARIQEMQRDYQQQLAAFWTSAMTGAMAGVARRPEPPPEAGSAEAADLDELKRLRARLEVLEKKVGRQ